MTYADLHVHTTRSDGSLELAAVPDAARRADVNVVAITDHDRLQPFDEPIHDRDGVTIVNGIELRVELRGDESADTGDGSQRVDLLAYGVEPTAELESLTASIQENRIDRGQAIVDNVEGRLGIELDVAVTDGFGRPHVARAVDAHPETDYDYEGAFDHLIGDDDPCFVARDVPSFEAGRRVLSEAAQLVSLAHPLRYPDPDGALEHAAALDAVELAYPYGHEVDLRPVEQAIEHYDLLATGGTDAHDETLGVAGLTKTEFDRLNVTA